VVSRAQRENVNLWSIYSPGIGHRSRSFGLSNLGQNNLSKMTDETGGESYYLGTSAPVSFKPYLDELHLHLANQYLLTFAGDGGAKGKFVRIQIKTELPEVEFSHAVTRSLLRRSSKRSNNRNSRQNALPISRRAFFSPPADAWLFKRWGKRKRILRGIRQSG